MDELEALTSLLAKHKSEAWMGGWRCEYCGFQVSINDTDERITWIRHLAVAVIAAGYTTGKRIWCDEHMEPYCPRHEGPDAID